MYIITFIFPSNSNSHSHIPLSAAQECRTNTEAWEIYQWPHLIKLIILPSPATLPGHWILSTGWFLMLVLSIGAGICPGSSLCSSCANDHSCYDSMSAVAMSHQDDSRTSPHPPALTVFLPPLLWCRTLAVQWEMILMCFLGLMNFLLFSAY